MIITNKVKYQFKDPIVFRTTQRREELKRKVVLVAGQTFKLHGIN